MVCARARVWRGYGGGRGHTAGRADVGGGQDSRDLMKSWPRREAALGLADESKTRAVERKERNRAEKPSGCSRAGGSFPPAMANMTRSTDRTSHRGGVPWAISIAEMPSDHTSARASYLPFCTTSGAIQCGVPMIELRFDAVEFSCAATPKSASLIAPCGAQDDRSRFAPAAAGGRAIERRAGGGGREGGSRRLAAHI